MGKPEDAQHRRFNYELCEAIDTLKLGIVLDRMVEAGKLHPRLAELYRGQAGCLLALLRSENNRAHGF